MDTSAWFQPRPKITPPGSLLSPSQGSSVHTEFIVVAAFPSHEGFRPAFQNVLNITAHASHLNGPCVLNEITCFRFSTGLA